MSVRACGRLLPNADGSVTSAVFTGTLKTLKPFVPEPGDEMERVTLWSPGEALHPIDETNLAILAMLRENVPPENKGGQHG